jgi:hypothetical protein
MTKDHPVTSTFPTPQNARLSERIRDFFYREEIPFSLAVVRIIMPIVLFCVMWPRWFHARELYSNDGAPCPLGFVYGWADLLPTFSGEVVVVLHTVLLLTLIASSIGWCTRLSLGLSTVLYVYLNMLDAVSTITKYSVIASHVMLLLTLSQCGAVWSVDSWLKGYRRRKNPWPGEPAVPWPKFPVWPQRLMQLMIGLVYLGAAVTKMHTPEFFSGDQMTYWMLSNVNYHNPGGEFLSQYPSLVVTSGYFVIVWEILFLFLAWKGLGRKIMIPLGLVFHIMTLITLGLLAFPAVCGAIYFAFLGEEDFRRFGVHLRRWRRRWHLPRLGVKEVFPGSAGSPRSLHGSWALYAAAVLVVSVVGVGAEHALDPYGLRRPEGRYTLKEVAPDVAAQWLRGTEAIREEDKVFSFDIGTFAVADSLANRRKIFRHGERLIAQVSLNPPHEDMYIECNLHDDQDRVVDRVGSIVPREKFRGHFVYSLNTFLTPGEYQLVLSHAGKELTRRTFQLLPNDAAPNPQSASAN